MILLKYGDMCAHLHSFRSSLTTHGEQSWRRIRRASQEALTKKRVSEFHPLHEKEAVWLIDGILQNPKGWDGEFRR